jgi:HK97 family phage major capsid protein
MKRLIQNPKWTMIALAAVMAIALLAGCQPAHAELMLAGIGGLPMVMGNTDLLRGQEEFKRLLVATLDSVEESKAYYDRELNKLSQDVADQMLKLNRPDMGGATKGLGLTGADHDYKNAFIGWMRSGREADLQTKSMSAGSDPDGGYLIPRQLDSLLTKVLRETSPMRMLARVVQADSGDFSMVHSVGGTAYGWAGETESPSDTDAPQFQLIKPQIGTIYAQPALSQNLLEDNAFDLENWLLEELSESLGEGEGVAFITGNGINKPTGIISYDTTSEADGVRDNKKLQYVASGASGAFAASAPADKLVKLVHSLKPRYRAGAAWLLNTNTLEQVRVMKDSAGDYIWKQTDQAQQIGATGTLLGYPVYEDEQMPDIAANSLSIAFGNFQRGYTIVDRSTRLIRDPFTLKPFTRFYTTRRVGGAVRDTRAIKLMKFAAS